MRLVWTSEDVVSRPEYLDDWGGYQVSIRVSRSVFGADGLIRDEFGIVSGRAWGIQFLTPGPKPDPGGIRSAHCVIEMPDEPTVALSKLTPSEAA